MLVFVCDICLFVCLCTNTFLDSTHAKQLHWSLSWQIKIGKSGPLRKSVRGKKQRPIVVPFKDIKTTDWLNQ